MSYLFPKLLSQCVDIVSGVCLLEQLCLSVPVAGIPVTMSTQFICFVFFYIVSLVSMCVGVSN